MGRYQSVWLRTWPSPYPNPEFGTAKITAPI
jgi:hypothetical protein